MNRTTNHIDDKVYIRSRYFSWKQFIMAFIALFLFSSVQGQTNIFISSFSEFSVPLKGVLYTIMIIAFWAIIAAVLIFIQHWQIERSFGKPLIKLCAAIKEVAGGNFFVRLSPDRKPKKKDYIDETYENFNMMVKELSSIETMKDGFIADISHELKTPLSIIQGYSTAIQEPMLDDERRVEYARNIEDATVTLTTLITNVLKLNKLENLGIGPVLKRFNLSRQLSDCILALSDRIEEKALCLEATIDEYCFLASDEAMLSIVWQNLLANAIKFTDPGGSVSIKQIQDEATVTVIVEDTGRGMDEEATRRSFDKFYQGDTSHSEEGNGLGLALCWKIMEIIGGEISAESALGVGSTFKVVLPKNAPQKRSAPSGVYSY